MCDPLKWVVVGDIGGIHAALAPAGNGEWSCGAFAFHGDTHGDRPQVEKGEEVEADGPSVADAKASGIESVKDGGKAGGDAQSSEEKGAGTEAKVDTDRAEAVEVVDVDAVGIGALIAGHAIGPSGGHRGSGVGEAETLAPREAEIEALGGDVEVPVEILGETGGFDVTGGGHLTEPAVEGAHAIDGAGDVGAVGAAIDALAVLEHIHGRVGKRRVVELGEGGLKLRADKVGVIGDQRGVKGQCVLVAGDGVDGVDGFGGGVAVGQ